jgi:hypothetical protein
MAKKNNNAQQPEVKPAAAATSPEVTGPVVSTEERLAKAEAEKQTLLGVIEELQKKNVAAESRSSVLPTVSIAGVLHEITVPKISYEGKEYTAQELAENTKLAAELKEIGANVFRVSEEA